MEQKMMQSAIDNLLIYWENQNIKSKGKKQDEIENIEARLKIKFPQDVKQYFQMVNGMEKLYPNYTDHEGFLFYPLEHLTTYQEEFDLKSTNEFMLNYQCIIFSNYMQKSWWYGILYKKDESPDQYSIVIIPNSDSYKVISNSFAEFIAYYINDSPKMYDYK